MNSLISIEELFYSTMRQITMQTPFQSPARTSPRGRFITSFPAMAGLDTHAGEEDIGGFEKLLEEAGIDYVEADKAAKLPSTMKWHEGKYDDN